MSSWALRSDPVQTQTQPTNTPFSLEFGLTGLADKSWELL